MNEYLEMWKHYADFSGRTTVRGYWMAVLFNFLALLILNVLASFVDLGSILVSVYQLAALIPGLAITIRRLRDAGCHWANIFWSFLPIVGAIILIVKLCKASAVPQQSANY